MNQYELIRIAHRVYGKSIREISREYGHHRSTVRKALAGTEPGYQRSETPDSPVMGEFSQIVERWLLDDRNSPKKQRHTARRIYARLVEEHDFKGAESTVRVWVRRKKQELGFETAEAMVPLCPEAGKEAEIDWGVARVIMRGVPIKAKLFCMRSRYSGKSFVRAYPLERREMFFDAHIHGFSYFGGVHPVLVYDNLTTAVKRVLKGKAREEQAGFVSFRSYYTFQARFRNLGKGHEKGGVEGLVGYSRRNFLTPVPEVNDFEELNVYLIEKCDRHAEKVLPGRGDKNIRHCFEEEKEKLLPLPSRPFDEARPIMEWRERWPTAYEIMLDQMRIRHGESKGTSEFLSVLMLHREFSEERVATAVEEAVKSGVWSSGAVKQLLFLNSETTPPVFPLSEELIPNVMDIILPAPDIGRYDGLLSGGSS